jgi:glycine hydroxymethyltransferase
MMLVDLRAQAITGREAEQALGEVCITCNKNSIPHDPQKPVVTSGIRLGTPAITTRGFGVEESRQVADLVADIIQAPHDVAVRCRVSEQVRELCRCFPVYA